MPRPANDDAGAAAVANGDDGCAPSRASPSFVVVVRDEC